MLSSTTWLPRSLPTSLRRLLQAPARTSHGQQMRLPRLQPSQPASSSAFSSSATANFRHRDQTMAQVPSPNAASRGRSRKRTSANKNQRASASTAARPATGPVAVPQSAEAERANGNGAKRFADTGLSDAMKAVIPFETMSEIQAATLEAVLAGQDVLAQAKTGTGKTLAFLIPAVERLRSLKLDSFNSPISILIISPTRELAAQIARECKPLLNGTPFGVQCVVGGTNIKTELNKLKNERCDILVATPGRLKDHLENNGLSAKLAQLKFFILDEADRLLDMGFKPDVERILRSLPDRRSVDRQSMLFSATIPNEVLKVKNLVLKQGHAHISTLKEEDINAHLHVPQSFVIADLHDHLAVLHQVIEQEIKISGPKAKLMVFFPTARATGLGAEVMKIALKGRLEVFELHSRISQGVRTKVAKKFNDCQAGVLATSDVSGRGVDYPNVTTVIQVGLPMTPEDYVHRLGRTARGGADGKGIIILAPFERKFLERGSMQTMPLEPHQLPEPIDRSITDGALDRIPDKEKEQAYQAWLGYYNGRAKMCGFSSAELVSTANEYVKDGLRYAHDAPPGLLAKTVGMMGLRGTPGLRIVKPEIQEGAHQGAHPRSNHGPRGPQGGESGAGGFGFGGFGGASNGAGRGGSHAGSRGRGRGGAGRGRGRGRGGA